MTMMMTPPKDDNFQAVLAPYMAEPDDDGFSDDLFLTLNTREKLSVERGQLTRLKTGFVMGGCFMGGVIAATQLKPAWGLLTETPLLTGPLTLAAIFSLFAFVVWNSLDNKEAGSL